MEEISLHIVDIVINSIAADSSLIEIFLDEQPKSDRIDIRITDNGCGMDEEMLKTVCDPFVTGRKTRRVGLGISLFKLAAERTGGSFSIKSEKGNGTEVCASFGYGHIDRQPIGDMASVIHQLIIANENTDFIYTHRVAENEFRLDTREIKRILGGVSPGEPEVMVWLSEYLKEKEQGLYRLIGKE